jgi:hypothetical protein
VRHHGLAFGIQFFFLCAFFPVFCAADTVLRDLFRVMAIWQTDELRRRAYMLHLVSIDLQSADSRLSILCNGP